MKQTLIRVSIVSGVIVAGLIAVAGMKYWMRSPEVGDATTQQEKPGDQAGVKPSPEQIREARRLAAAPTPVAWPSGNESGLAQTVNSVNDQRFADPYPNSGDGGQTDATSSYTGENGASPWSDAPAAATETGGPESTQPAQNRHEFVPLTDVEPKASGNTNGSPSTSDPFFNRSQSPETEYGAVPRTNGFADERAGEPQAGDAATNDDELGDSPNGGGEAGISVAVATPEAPATNDNDFPDASEPDNAEEGYATAENEGNASASSPAEGALAEPARMPTAELSTELAAPAPSARPDGQSTSIAANEGTPGAPQLEGEQGASLVVHKTGPPEVQVNMEAKFEIRVQNVGDAPAHDVEIHDLVPRGAELVATQPQIDAGPKGELVWGLGTLNPGEEATVELRLVPRAEGEIGSVARVYFSADAAARTLVTRPELELAVEAPRSVLSGERAPLLVRVTNVGTGAATGVALEEIVPDGFEHPEGATLEYVVGTLRPGESRELPLTLAAVKPAHGVNVLRATAEGGIAVEQRTELDIVAPELRVELQGPRRRFLDREATYTIAVANPGTAPAREVELVTFLSPGMEFVKADNAGQYDPQTRAVYWLLDELPPNEMGAVSVTARPTAPGEHILRVEGHAQRGLEAVEEQAIEVEGLAAVEFQVVDLSDPVEVGGEAAYEIVVTNNGTKAADNVEVMAVLPLEMKLVEASGPSRHEVEGQKVRFQAIASLAPGATETFRLTTKTVEAGDARLQIKLLTADMQTPVTKEENTKVFGDE